MSDDVTNPHTLGHLILTILTLPEGKAAPLAAVQLLAMPTHPENVRSVLNHYIEGGEVRLADGRYHLTRYGQRVLASLGEFSYA